MVEEIKEEKIGTSNKQTVIWPNYLNYLNYKKKKKKFICQCRKKNYNGRLPVQAKAHQSWLPTIKTKTKTHTQ